MIATGRLLIISVAAMLVACASGSPARPRPHANVASFHGQWSPPAQPLKCPDGLARSLFEVDWAVFKEDEPSQPAHVAVYLNHPRTCVVAIGDLPRICSVSGDKLELVCKEHDGTKVHRVSVRQQEHSVEVWVETPDQTVRLASVAL